MYDVFFILLECSTCKSVLEIRNIGYFDKKIVTNVFSCYYVVMGGAVLHGSIHVVSKQ